MSKKLSKLPFVDRSRFNKGVLMDAENQLVTLAVKPSATFDVVQLTDAVESGGYKVEQIFTLSADGQREPWSQ